MSKYHDLTQASFSMKDLIHQEALFLSDYSPLKNDPKRPCGSKSHLTQMSKFGEGPAHCIVQKWPSNVTPVEWGKRNPILLDDCILPELWESLVPYYIDVKCDVASSQLLGSNMR